MRNHGLDSPNECRSMPCPILLGSIVVPIAVLNTAMALSSRHLPDGLVEAQIWESLILVSHRSLVIHHHSSFGHSLLAERERRAPSKPSSPPPAAKAGTVTTAATPSRHR